MLAGELVRSRVFCQYTVIAFCKYKQIQFSLEFNALMLGCLPLCYITLAFILFNFLELRILIVAVLLVEHLPIFLLDTSIQLPISPSQILALTPFTD